MVMTWKELEKEGNHIFNSKYPDWICEDRHSKKLFLIQSLWYLVLCHLGQVSNCIVSILLPLKWGEMCLTPEKAMAPHSSTLAWKIPWMEEPGRLQSMGSQRVGHDWATSLSLFTFMHWRRKWQPTPMFLPGESQGRGSLMGCCLCVA